MVFTKAQAKSLAILDVARSLGMEMKRKSHREYYWAEHDSFKIDTLKNIWHWYARGTYGDTISLVQEMRNVSYSTAMKFLETGQFPEAKPMEEVRQPFRYTLAAYEQPFKEARTYLKETRGLSDETINFFLDKGVLAQAKRTDREGFTEDVLVFKYLNREKKLVGASLQGLIPYPDRHEGKGYLKHTMYGTEGVAGLNIAIGTPKRLVVAEAPIDLMSYYELHKDELQDVRLVAMDGVKAGVVSRYALELFQELGVIPEETIDYTQIKNLTRVSTFLEKAAKVTNLFHNHNYDHLITLAVDQDKAGEDFITNFQKKKIPVIDARPPKGNGQEKMDWNEYLKKEKAGEKQMGNTSIQPATQALIDEGLVNQWAKQPNLYFVKGLRKVAVELSEDGTFVESTKYRPNTDEEKELVKSLLDRQSIKEKGISDELNESLAIEQTNHSEIVQTTRVVESIYPGYLVLLQQEDNQNRNVYLGKAEKFEAGHYDNSDQSLIYLFSGKGKELRDGYFLLGKGEPRLSREEYLKAYGSEGEKVYQRFDAIVQMLENDYHLMMPEQQKAPEENQEQLTEPQLQVVFDFTENKKLSRQYSSGDIIPYKSFISKLYEENELQMIGFKLGYDKTYFALTDEKGNRLINNFRYDIGTEKQDLSEQLAQNLPTPYLELAQEADRSYANQISYGSLTGTIKTLTESVQNKIQRGQLSIHLSDEVYFYTLVNYTGWSYPMQQLRPEALDALKEHRSFFESINETNIERFKEKGTPEQNQMYQLLKGIQKELGRSDTSTIFSEEVAISAYNLNKRLDSLTAENWGKSISEPLNSLGRDTWNILSYPANQIDTPNNDYFYQLVPYHLLEYLEHSTGQTEISVDVYEQILDKLKDRSVEVIPPEKDIAEVGQMEPFSDTQKEHIREFFKTRISDVKTDYIYLPNGQEDIAYCLDGYLFANHYAELDMLSPSKQVDALMNRLVSEDGQKVDHVALGFDIERIDQKFLEENLGYNPDTPIEDYRYSEKNIDRVAEKEEQEFRTKFDRCSFAETIGLMQKYSPEEVLNESNSYHDDVRYQSLLIDLGKVNTDPMYRFIEHYINRDIDREALSQFSVQDFITIAQEKGLLNEEPSVKPWKAITVTQPVNSYTVFTDKLSKEFDNVSDLYQFVNKKLKRSQRRELSSLLSESGRGTPLDTLMAIDSVANVEVNGQDILSLFPNDINEEATEIYLRSSAEIEETTNVAQAEKEKAPDRSQEPSSNAGDSHRNPDSLGDLSPGAASKPVVDEPQPDFPVIAHLNFTTKEERMSTIKPGYHVITNGELNRLNKFAPGLQATAQWYLKELSGSTISYLYQDGETLGKLSVQFSDENFAHLTGISPKGIEMRQVVYDFAQGVGDYGNIQVSHAIKDKSMVLPLLPDILSSQSFVFNDLSEVEKFNRIDLSQAIKTNDEDLLLAIRDVDGVGIPASVMRMKEKLSESLKGKENIVLAVYRQRDGKLDQMSINEEYVKDGGKRFEDILKNDEFSRYQEELYKEETEQLSFKRDSDGDGISDEEELKQGTNPYDFRSTPTSKPAEENELEPEEMQLAAGSVAVADLIKNKDIAGLNQHLKEGIKAYLNSDHYKEFLTKMSQFNQYSSRNLRLILAQKPDASYLAPYNTWRKFERHVKRGEKALSVIIPVTYVKKDQQGQPILDKNGKPETGMTFRLKPTTFDVSQTEGKEMPKAAEVKEQLTDLDYANLYRALMSIAKTNDVSVRFEEMAGETKGYYSPAEHQIVLRSHDMNKSQLIKTFIHETAHSELHHSNHPQREQLTRSNAELQAESVAYVVASYYGIDTSDYSFDYLAGWSKDKETLADLEAQLDIVQQEAKSLMVRMDQELEQLQLIQQRQSKQHFEQKLQKFKDQSKRAAEEHKQEVKQEAQSKKEEGLSK